MYLSFRGKLQRKYGRCGNRKELYGRTQWSLCDRLVHVRARAHTHTHTSTQYSTVRLFCFSRSHKLYHQHYLPRTYRIKNHIPLVFEILPWFPAESWAWVTTPFPIQVIPISPVTPSTVLYSIKRGSLQSPNRPWSFLPSWHYAYSFCHFLFQRLCLSKMLSLFLKRYSTITPPVKSHHSKHHLYLFAQYPFSFLFLENQLPTA